MNFKWQNVRSRKKQLGRDGVVGHSWAISNLTLGNKQLVGAGNPVLCVSLHRGWGTTFIRNADGGSCSLPTLNTAGAGVLGKTELLRGPQIVSKGHPYFCPFVHLSV